jgi:DNA-directed RNA polymerase III subunit RPC1
MVAATQDFLTGSYLITRKNTFFHEAQMRNYCSFCCDALDYFELPPPAIVKPMRLWTGKQLFTLLIRPSPHSKALTSEVDLLINTELGESQYEKKNDKDLRRGRHMCPQDSYVCFRNSELMCGCLGKATLGAGNKNGLFYTMLRDCDAETAADRMTRLAKLCSRWMGLHGFTFGVEDVMPTADITEAKAKAMRTANSKCADLIALYKKGTLERVPGCDLELSLEQMIGKELDGVRNEVSSAAKGALHYDNKVLTCC